MSKGGSGFVAGWAAARGARALKAQLNFAAHQAAAKLHLKKNLDEMSEEERKKAEEENLDRVQIVPNRRMLRQKGINIRKGKGQYGRLVRYRLAPASFHNLIRVTQTRPDGTKFSIVIPRENYNAE